jgi:hypothetical protein
MKNTFLSTTAASVLFAISGCGMFPPEPIQHLVTPKSPPFEQMEASQWKVISMRCSSDQESDAIPDQAEFRFEKGIISYLYISNDLRGQPNLERNSFSMNRLNPTVYEVRHFATSTRFNFRKRNPSAPTELPTEWDVEAQLRSPAETWTIQSAPASRNGARRMTIRFSNETKCRSASDPWQIELEQI